MKTPIFALILGLLLATGCAESNGTTVFIPTDDARSDLGATPDAATPDAATPDADATTPPDTAPDLTVQPDVAPVCAAGATQACTCADNREGSQSCFSDGSGWLPCVCAPPLVTGQQRVTITETHPGGGRQCIEAKCPAGMNVLGGGGSWDATKVKLDQHGPLEGNRWTICGIDFTGGTQWTAEAICATVVDKGTYAFRSENFDKPKGGTCQEIACPEGMFALSGGGFWSQTPSVQLDHSDWSPEGWQFCGLGAGDSSWELTVVCMTVPAGKATAEKDTFDIGASGTDECHTKACPAGLQATSAGAYFPAASKWNSLGPTTANTAEICLSSAEAVQSLWIRAVCADLD